ncbi:MAG: RNA polymerase sigma factor [Desulfobulbaceae bacterium]|nr:RNA polymerase sigma factor [Desulfobulbaceae bacterium]
MRVLLLEYFLQFMQMIDSYQQFYEEHKNRLFSYLLYKCGDYETSLDIMQESFTRHFQHYRDRALSSPALLFTIARNALIDHHRPLKKFVSLEVEELPAAITNDTEQIVLIREQYRKVKEAIDTLPESEREILSLAVGGLAYKEIAFILDLSEANIKVKIHRARTKLRELLGSKEAS